MKNSQIFWERAQPFPSPLAAYGASILASSALDLRPAPNVPVALTPMMAGQTDGRSTVS